MKYLIYTLSNGEDGVFAIVEDEDDVCEDYEEVVRRYFAQRSELTLNLRPDLDRRVLRLNLSKEGISVDSTDWLESGVPDILVFGGSGEKKFVEVKSSGDGLNENQLSWAQDFDFNHSVAYVVELEENVKEIDHKIGDEDLFQIDESIGGRELLIDYFYRDILEEKIEDELRGVLDELADKRLVSERDLTECSDLPGVHRRERVDEILDPLLNTDRTEYPVVLRYRAGGDIFYFLSTIWISSDLDLSWKERRRIERFIGGWKKLSEAKEERSVDKELVYDFW